MVTVCVLGTTSVSQLLQTTEAKDTLCKKLAPMGRAGYEEISTYTQNDKRHCGLYQRHDLGVVGGSLRTVNTTQLSCIAHKFVTTLNSELSLWQVVAILDPM